jgi:hypothetical protein
LFHKVVVNQFLFQIDIVFPVITVLQFIFFFGWMKVAGALLNPFGMGGVIENGLKLTFPFIFVPIRPASLVPGFVGMNFFPFL